MQFRRSVLIIALGCFFQFANAQIVYTDVNPDQTQSSGSYNIDLNKDGVNDFTLKETQTTYSLCNIGGCSPVHETGFTFSLACIMNNEGGSGSSDKLDKNTLIDSTSLTWQSGTIILDAISWSGHCTFGVGCQISVIGNGDWGADTNKYLALRILSGSQNYYGWVRLDWSGVQGFTVKDYAYNSIPDQAILAGQTCLPQAVISPAGPISFCTGDSAGLTSINSGSDLSYQWKKDGANIPGATGKSYTAKSAGKYKVKVTDNTNSCTATSAAVKVKVPCKVMNEEVNENSNSDFKAYPNPFSKSTSISLSLPRLEKISLQIFDVEGRLIRTLADEEMSEGAHTLTWDARDKSGNEVSDGIYFLRMQTASEVKTISISILK